MKHCKKKCEGWGEYIKCGYYHTINKFNMKPWVLCPWCGFELIDKEAELREDVFQEIQTVERAHYGGAMPACTRNGLVYMLFNKYDIKKRG